MNHHAIVFQYFSELSQDQKEKIIALQELYTYWNEQINVISRKDIDFLYERHVLHALSIAKFIGFKPQSHVLDIGTGGGFPGIPLAIFFPDVQFHLVDSIGKKIKVVNAVIEALGLNNVIAEHQRAEKVKGQYDFVVSRAVSKLRLLEMWSRNKIKLNHEHQIKNGIICLKGGDLKEELLEVKHKVKQINLSQYFQESFFETKKIIYLPIK